LERLKFNIALRKWYQVGHWLEYVTGLQFPQNSSGQSLIYSVSILILSQCFCLASGSTLSQQRLTWLGESPHVWSNEDHELFLCE
jgi:hypothetical protein